MNPISVPFRIQNVLDGLAEANGVLSLREDFVRIEFQTTRNPKIGLFYFSLQEDCAPNEFQTKDSIFGGIKTGVSTVDIPISDIEELHFKKGIFGNALTIRLSSIGESVEIPNQQAGVIRVSIDKNYIEAALNFVSAVKLEVVDQKIKAFESV
jgi:hypothetical protein